MESDILDSLADIKYSGPIKTDILLLKAIEDGPKSIEYTKLVSFIAMKLKEHANLEESINPITTPSDSSSFLMEVSSYLKELGCPYESLTMGHLSDRLCTKQDKLLLLDYLLSEYMTARMLKVMKPQTEEMAVQINESETAKYLKNLLLCMQFNKPPPNITSAMLFSKVESKLREILKNSSPDLLGRPAFTGHLSDKQWMELLDLQKNMHKEYTVRREMLLKRLNVTIQSFKWSDKVKGKENMIDQMYNKKALSMVINPGVDVSDLLAARDDITILEKTSSASVRKNTQSSINKVMIGQVPDRGGRPSEQAPPPPEMPSWQQRGSGGGGAGSRGGRGRGGGGGRGNHDSDFSQDGGRGKNFAQDNAGRGGRFAQDDGRTGGYSQDSGRGNFSGPRGGYSQDSGFGGPNHGGNRGYSQNQGGYGGYNRGGGVGGNVGYDAYRQNTASYADQYVQDSSQNQEYGGNYNRGRGGNGGGSAGYRGRRGGGDGGRSNYNRGGNNYR